MNKEYEAVIGLEVHAELCTKTKLLCNCPNAYGREPNTLICPVCTAMPGALPSLNKEAVKYTIKAGLALNCSIAAYTKMDRKNYFYPDLPKGYQITQYDKPICTNGYIDIDTNEGIKRIGIERIHLEEDAGKLIHDSNKGTLVDLNRSGVPLIEIVSRPDMSSSIEAVKYLQKLRTCILYTGISDCKMNEGSLRCDVNISAKEKGSKTLGTKTEIKNINSFSFIGKAIEYEFERQVSLLKKGENVVKETRRFDSKSGKTFSMRHKEDSNEYRYFCEPDLVPFTISETDISRIKETIPKLPDERKKIYTDIYNLNSNICYLLLEDIKIADYFEECTKYTKNTKLLANLLTTDLFCMINKNNVYIPIKPHRFSALVNLIANETINVSTAKSILKKLWDIDFDPVAYIEENNLSQINNLELLKKYIEETIKENEKTVNDYRRGKLNALKALTGFAMAKSKGRANPTLINKLLKQVL